MDEPRVWAAAVGTPLDGPGWIDIAHLNDDTVRDEPPTPDLSRVKRAYHRRRR